RMWISKEASAMWSPLPVGWRRPAVRLRRSFRCRGALPAAATALVRLFTSAILPGSRGVAQTGSTLPRVRQRYLVRLTPRLFQVGRERFGVFRFEVRERRQESRQIPEAKPALADPVLTCRGVGHGRSYGDRRSIRHSASPVRV